MTPKEIPEWLFYSISVWITLWMGLVLWRSARFNQKIWFILFMFIHTAGILESVYLFYFAKKRLTFSEIKKWFRDAFFERVK